MLMHLALAPPLLTLALLLAGDGSPCIDEATGSPALTTDATPADPIAIAELDPDRDEPFAQGTTLVPEPPSDDPPRCTVSAAPRRTFRMRWPEPRPPPRQRLIA